MELFYSSDIEGGICRLDHDESGHCVKVLRHRAGDEISVIDGCGTLYRCRITSDSHKGVEAMVLDKTEDWGAHPYRLHMAVCPTKNNDRYEWFAEKATEIGFDELTFLDCRFSERKVVKTERVEKILVSAMKQSLKPTLPILNGMTPFDKFINYRFGGKKFIAHCYDGDKLPLMQALQCGEDALVLIGPEGDFSPEEVQKAIANGFQPITLGHSRLRTETAALVAVHTMNLVNSNS